MSCQTELDDDREDWAAMHDWSNYVSMASYKQNNFVKSLEEQKCLFESDYKKGERGERLLLTAKRANRLIRLGIKRQKEIQLQKAKEASCH